MNKFKKKLIFQKSKCKLLLQKLIINAYKKIQKGSITNAKRTLFHLVAPQLCNLKEKLLTRNK